MLREKGRCVCSPSVPGDPVDMQMHSLLRSMPPGVAPVVMWFVQHGEYIIDEDHLVLCESHGQLLAQDVKGVGSALIPVQDLLQQRLMQRRNMTKGPRLTGPHLPLEPERQV